MLVRSTQTWKYSEHLMRRFSSFDPKTYTFGFSESMKDTAYWVANALVMSESEPFNDYAPIPDYSKLFWEDNAMQHFSECDITRKAVLDSLQQMHSFVRNRSRGLDVQFWKSGQRRSNYERFAQAVSCLLLEEQAGKFGIAAMSPDQHDVPNHQGFPYDLKCQFVAVIPFVLVSCIQDRESSSFSRLNKYRPANTLRVAIEHIQSSIVSSRERYEEFINLCFEQMSISNALEPGVDSTVSAHRMRKIAAGIAGLMPIAEVLVASQAENARNNLNMPATIAEDDEFRPDAKRTSTSSLPTLARSYRSSTSSDYGFFSRIRHSIAFSLDTQQTRSSGDRTSRSSLMFSRTTSLSSNPSLMQRTSTVSSDVTMDE